MAKNIFTNESNTILTNNGQAFHRLSGNPNQRLIYPAIVREISDTAGYNRIKAEIVNINSKGEIYSGRDKDSSLEQMALAIPMLPEFMHVRPQVGECVLIFLENPTDPTSARYYIGPIITQQTKLNFQTYQSAQAIYNKGSYNSSQIGIAPSTENENDAGELFAKQNEIAFQGRQNGDLVIGNNIVKIRTGIFKGTNFKENTDFPCQIELKIVEQPISTTGIKAADIELNKSFEPFSQQNIRASNINFISPEGKFRKSSLSTQEAKYNPRINDFGEEAKTLHPAVLGDELVEVIILIINYLFTHAHPPQSPPLPNNYGFKLESLRNNAALSAKVLSNNIRLN